jgi:hypothetical protein
MRTPQGSLDATGRWRWCAASERAKHQTSNGDHAAPAAAATASEQLPRQGHFARVCPTVFQGCAMSPKRARPFGHHHLLQPEFMMINLPPSSRLSQGRRHHRVIADAVAYAPRT